MLLIEDHNLVRGEFLELLNSLISCGEIPGLFAPEEVEHIFSNPEDVRREHYGMTLYEAFCSRVRANVRIVLSLDHKQENFAANCAANPALFTRCSVVWLESWSRESMAEIVRAELHELLADLDKK